MHNRKIRKFLQSNKGCLSTPGFNLILLNDTLKSFSFENGHADKLLFPFLWEADSELKVVVQNSYSGRLWDIGPCRMEGKEVVRDEVEETPKGDSLNPIHGGSSPGMALQN